MPCCHYSRRQFLALAAAASVPIVAGGLVDPGRAWASPRPADGGRLVATSLELVTLTETSAVLTWTTFDATSTPDSTGRLTPMPADTVVLLGTLPTSLVQVYGDDTQTPYHHAEITGLTPGTPYFFAALSGGVPALPAPAYQGNPVGTAPLQPGAAVPAGPYAFTTPQPPQGRFLFSLALANDVHIGETVAGLATTLGLPTGQSYGLPPGISGPVGGLPYPEVMARALTTDVAHRGAVRTLVAGDLTSEASQADSSRARQLLDGLGTLGADYLVARGNHDRAHASGAAVDACSPSAVAGPGFHDCFSDTFGHQDPAGTTWFTKAIGGMRLICLDTYDKPGNGGDNGMLGATQYDWFASQLADDPETPTLVFGHHPISVESTLVNTGPVRFDMDAQQALQIEQLYAKAPGVFFHQAGHTHRNKRSASTASPQVTYHETSATKEYPGGFSLLRVHSGGYALNFYKFRSQAALEWSDRTRQEYAGTNPYYTNGSLADRNYVVARDLSDLRPVGPTAALPEAGMAVGMPLLAAAAGAAVLKLRRRGGPS